MSKNYSSQINSMIEKAYQAMQLGRHDEARKIYDKLTINSSNDPIFANIFAQIALELNLITEGIIWLRKSLEINPDQPAIILNLGSSFSKINQFENALDCFSKAIKLDSNVPLAHFNEGLVYRYLNQLDNALNSYKNALKINPNYIDALNGVGRIYHIKKEYYQAIEYYDKAIKSQQNFAGAFYNKAMVMDDLKEYFLAIDNYFQALKYKPDYFEAYNNLGNTFHKLKRYDEALSSYDNAIQLKPDYHEPHNGKGNTLRELMRYDEALSSYNLAIQMNPNYCESYNNKAILLNEIGQFNEALENINKAIALNPEHPEAYNTKGLVLHESHRFDEALQHYNKAIELSPEYLEAYQNMAICYLNKCDFKKGWYFWEFRENLQLNFRQDFKKKFSELGNVFIFSEQGIGDVILYSCLLGEIDLQSNKVSVEIDPRLINLLQRSFKNIEFLTKENKPIMQNFDSQLGIASLPGYFRKDIQSFSQQKKPFLKPDQNKVDFYKKKLLKKNTKKIICGISWRSTNKKVGSHKSLLIEDFKKALNYPEIIFVNLQYNITIEEQNFFAKHLGDNFQNFSDLDLYNDIDSLTSLIEACDFIITSSNINAHIAGALDKKTFLLVPFGKGRFFYWHQNFSQCLWYPSIEIFNQSSQGDWQSPIDLIKKRVKEDYLL